MVKSQHFSFGRVIRAIRGTILLNLCTSLAGFILLLVVLLCNVSEGRSPLGQWVAAEDWLYFNNAIITHLFLSRHQSHQQSAAGVSQAEVQCGQSAGAPLAAGSLSHTHTHTLRSSLKKRPFY